MKNRNKNILAHGDLILAQKDKVVSGLINKNFSEVLSKKDAYLAFKKPKICIGTTVTTMLSLKEYDTSRMTDESEDPGK